MKKNRTDKALFLDKYLMGALVFICAFFRLFKNRWTAFDKTKVRQIVVAKFVGLGSILILQNFFKRLRMEFPEAKIIFLTFSENKFLADLMKKEIDEVVTIPTSDSGEFLRWSFKIASELRNREVDLYFDCEFFSRYSALLQYSCQPKNSVGFSSPKLKLRSSLYSFKTPFNASIHVIENYYAYLKVLGLRHEPVSPGQAAELSVPMESSLEQKMRQLSLEPKKYMVFNPSASDALGGYRKWPVSEWVRLIEMTFRGGYIGSIVLTGLEADKASVDKIIKGLNSFEYAQRIYNTAGMFSLKEYLNFLSCAQMTVTVDSGTAHFSAALKTPTVILFGPETPVLYGYTDAWCKSVYLGLECSPCGNIHNGKQVHCHNENRCMTQMDADRVYQQMKEFL